MIIHPTPFHPMTTYLPGYTYLFASTARQEDAPYFVRLRKEYIRAVLQDLHDTFHHVYVQLENLPENRFAIIRYHNHMRHSLQPDAMPDDERFTLRHFRDHFDLLHEKDQFCVHFFTEVFYYEQEFTPQTLESIYRHYLKRLGTSGLRENSPMQLTDAQINGRTQTDAVLIRGRLRAHTADTLQDIEAEYTAHSSPECIEKTKR